MRFDRAAIQSEPAPWIHESLLLDAWPETTWREVLWAASPGVAPPQQLEGALTDGWRARASAVHATLAQAEKEFALMVDWLRDLGPCASGSRCLALGGAAAQGYCAWQLLQQPPTLEAEVHRVLAAGLPARDAVVILTDVSVAFIEAHHALSKQGRKVPVRFSTMSLRKDRTAVFAGFLPREPAPEDAPPVWVLEEELRKTIRPERLASFAVPEALRELEQLLHSHPEESEIFELLQSTLNV